MSLQYIQLNPKKKNSIEFLNIQFWNFLPKFNFLIHGAFTSPYWTAKFSNLYILTLSNQSSIIFWGILHVLSNNIYYFFNLFNFYFVFPFLFFWFFSLFYFFCIFIWASKIDNNMCHCLSMNYRAFMLYKKTKGWRKNWGFDSTIKRRVFLTNLGHQGHLKLS